jgi:hypothetical protein
MSYNYKVMRVKKSLELPTQRKFIHIVVEDFAETWKLLCYYFI